MTPGSMTRYTSNPDAFCNSLGFTMQDCFTTICVTFKGVCIAFYQFILENA